MERDRRFTNRQVVTMVAAICAAVVLAPVGALAATGSLVNVTDPVHSAYKARVSAAGRLLATACDGNSCAAVDGSSLRVGGTLASRPLAPSSAWHTMTFVNGPIKLVGPTGAAVDVTSLTVTPAGNSANFALQAAQVPATATSCSSGSTVYYLSALPANVPFTATFPTPLRIAPTSGMRVCLLASTGVGGTLWVNVSGFQG